MPMATCRETNQTVKANDLGKKYAITERSFALLEAQRLAANMTAKTSRTWTARVEEYNTDSQGRTRL